MTEIKVGIVGSTGYTALETARLLQSHPDAKIVCATARSDAGKSLGQVHPSMLGRCDIEIESFEAGSIAQRCDVVMCCLPHGASAEQVKQLAQLGTRVIDFSADFRLSDLDVYEHYYQVKHPWPERFGGVVYGMPEFFADQIRDADVVANPGCYPTSAIMPIAPLVRHGLIETDDIIIDSKSGVSGAGRGLKLGTLYCEANESISAYGVGTHRHGPEINDLVQRISGHAITSVFTPHLTPMDRGILSTIYVRPRDATAKDCLDCWHQTFADHPFISPVDVLPSTKNVAGTNYVQMTVREAGDRLVLICAIDNLAKGASGAAIQNMNVMFSLDQTVGLG